MATSDFDPVFNKVLAQDAIPDAYQFEGVFSEAEINEFEQNRIWAEIQRRLLWRFTTLFNSWLFEADRTEQDKIRGQAIELCYLLKTPGEMKPVTKKEQ